MGKVNGNWITGAHSGRACSKEQIYTKVNKKTGACYSVKLCNPNTEWSEDQLAQRSEFGAISKAISVWIKTNKEESGANHADYLTIKAAFDRQTKYSTLRGYMYAKGKYTIAEDGTVTVDITANTSGTKATDGASSDSNSGSSTTPSTPSGSNENSGGDDDEELDGGNQ